MDDPLVKQRYLDKQRKEELAREEAERRERNRLGQEAAATDR